MKATQLTLEQVVGRIDDLSQSARSDADKLKALDMLMKHLGGYVTVQDIIAKLDEQTAQTLLNQLLTRLAPGQTIDEKTTPFSDTGPTEDSTDYESE